MSAQVITVRGDTLTELRAALFALISTAKDISAESAFTTIKNAQDALNEAMGMHKVLAELNLLNGFEITTDDIERIKQKQESVLDEKRQAVHTWRN